MADMESLAVGDLRIDMSEPADRVVRLDWNGKSNAREPGKILGPFFDGVARRALETGARVEMHFEKLDHFNSSTITALIQYVQSSRSRGVPLVIYYNSALKWQRLSFDGLRIFEKKDGILTFKAI